MLDHRRRTRFLKEALQRLVVGYLGANDRYIDIRVYDHPDPIAELDRLYALHQLYFFQSRPEDLIPITPEVVRQLEPILLREPANQAEKWLAAPQGRATPAFLQALENFMYWENYDVRVRNDWMIDRVVLEDVIRSHTPAGPAVRVSAWCVARLDAGPIPPHQSRRRLPEGQRVNHVPRHRQCGREQRPIHM